MATKASSTLISLLLLSFSTTTLLTIPFKTNAKPEKLVTKLIHHNSILSPSYNPKHSFQDRADRILRNSLSRFNYLNSKGNTNSDNSNSVIDATYEANVQVDGHGFLVNLSIGQPPIPQLVIMDTGSKLLWVQCKPCIFCYDQKGPFYDSSSSSTFTTLSCFNSSCILISNTKCNRVQDCMYQIAYMDNSISRGCIGTEKLTFETSDEGFIVVEDVIFGCGQDNKLRVGGLGSGILGLGYSNTSIINKLGLRFSYCIGDMHNPSYLFNRLTLGDSAIIEGYSTHLEIENGFYYITLEGISVGEERLDIDPKVFKKNWQGEGGTIIDSGCELTYINQVAYNVLQQKVYSFLDGFLKPYVLAFNTYQMLCCQGKLREELVGFPVVTLHFDEGADLVLDIDNLFYQLNEDAFCMAVVPTMSDQQHNVIGTFAQQYYNVAYDLVQQKLYFQRIDCEVLGD